VILSTWPFIGALYVPLAFDVLRTDGLLKAIIWGVTSVSVVVAPILAVDFYYYKRLVSPCWNIFVYNVLGGSSGSQSELYGTEPWWFYILNCLLNLNLTFALGMLSGPVALYYHRTKAGGFDWQLLFFLMPMYNWFGFMNSQAHKEERFIFPIYPLFCFAAALGLSPFLRPPMSSRTLIRLSVYGILLGSCSLSLSRTVSTLHNYAAPLDAYQQLYGYLEHAVAHDAPGAESVVCVGKEWFRYPASFFLPSAPPQVRLGFVPSSFGGQLPATFQATDGTNKDGGVFNDQNKPEADRFTPLERCTYFVDLELADQTEEKMSQNDDWHVLTDLPFLDASKSRSPYRALFIPFLSSKHTVFARYLVLKRKH